MKYIPTIFLLFCLQSCTPTASSEFCLVAPGAVYLDDNEYVSDANARKLKEYDLYGIKHCGWK